MYARSLPVVTTVHPGVGVVIVNGVELAPMTHPIVGGAVAETTDFRKSWLVSTPIQQNGPKFEDSFWVIPG